MKFRNFLLLGVLFLTGCSVDYKLNIDKGLNFNESVQLKASTVQEKERIIDYNQFLPIDYYADDYSVYEEKISGVEYYDSKKLDGDTVLQFKYPYDIEKFNNNILALNCYQYVTAMNSNNTLILSTSKKFLCFDKFDELEDVTVTVTSRYKLIKTNADSSDNYTYVWKITKDNYKDRSLYLELDATDRKETWWEKFQKTGFYQYGIIIIIIMVVFIVFQFFKKKSERRDRI